MLDEEGTSRKARRVLRMPAAAEHSEQVEAALEHAAVARPERPLKLRVTRHAPSRPLLAQEDRPLGAISFVATLTHIPTTTLCNYSLAVRDAVFAVLASSLSRRLSRAINERLQP